MPKPHTFPTLYDECKTINVSDLECWKYLEPGQYKTGNLTWSRNGDKIASISIIVNTISDKPFLELNYKCNDKPVNYQVQLITISSNLNKGKLWFFVCPNSGKRCRKLYLADTYFLHRLAFRGCMYEKQTYSHTIRNMGRQFERVFGVDNAMEKIYSKNFKKYYNGKPTKKYLSLLTKMKKGQGFSEQDLLEFY